MSYEIALPKDEAPHNVVQLRAAAEAAPAGPASEPVVQADEQPDRPGVLERLQPTREQLAAAWSAAWVGDGAFGLQPRPVADLARQFWTQPKPYIADALILRIPYAIYGTPVIALSAAAHLLLFILSYPSVLAASALLALVIYLLS